MREVLPALPEIPKPAGNAVLLLAALVLFALDLSIPHGYTIWILYVPLCLGAAWLNRPRHALLAAALASVLIAVSWLISEDASASVPALVSRLLEIATIWLSIAVVLAYQRVIKATDEAVRVARETNDRISNIIIRNTEDAIVSINSDHRITLFNHGAERMFGRTAQEAIGQDLSILLPLYVVERHKGLVAGFAASPVQSRRMGDRGTIAGLRHDGTEFPAEITITKLETPEGLTFTAILRDISERVNAEQQARQQRQRLRLAMLAGRMGTFDFDQSAGVVRVDETTLRLLDLPLTETSLPYSVFFDRMLPDDRKAVFAKLDEARREGRDFSIEYRLPLEDGTVRWLAGRGYGELDEAGKPRHIVGVTYDITDRIMAERALRESEALNRSTLRSLPAQIAVIDMDGRILSANEPWIEFVHGRVNGDRGAYVGGDYFALMRRVLGDGQTTALADAGIREVLDGGRATFTLECTVPGSDPIGWILLTAVPLNHDDTAGAVVSCLDITQRKQAEALLSDTNRALEARVAERTAALREEIERREEAQAALLRSQKLQAVGELAGGMAHDFNNLLTVITGYLELLGLRQMDERAAELVRRAEDAARMGARLASRLLLIGRRHRLQPVTLNLNDVARSMTDVLRRTLGDQIEVKTSLADGLWPTQADLSEVENALLNLAINARDAMPDGGVLEVNTRNQSLGPDDVAGEAGLAPGEYVMLSVSDTGVGIAPDILPRVFEPYFSTKDAGRGTGLGLSTIYGFARQSGGHASIYSEVGKGTRVSLFLPRASEGAQAADARKPTAPAQASGERILVVEDNPDVREITIKRLDLLGYTVLTTETGVAAIEMLRSMPGIQLVFSDVVMPGGVSGFDLAAWIRANRPGVRILLTSGFTGEVARHGEEPEMANVPLLSKPYALPELARAVREALS